MPLPASHLTWYNGRGTSIANVEDEMDVSVEILYLCETCFYASDQPGVCPDCGHELVECRPGTPDDPCRRPLMDQEGRLLTRAPLWWVERYKRLADA
jgi:hypothetical protein